MPTDFFIHIRFDEKLMIRYCLQLMIQRFNGLIR